MENTEPKKLKVIKDEGICLSLPAFDRIDVPFVQCYSALLSSTNIVRMVDWLPGDSLVNRARNNLAGRFLDGFEATDDKGERVLVQHDWMLFLDTDLVFHPNDVIALYQLARARGPGIYCGTYPIKQLKPKVVFNAMPGCVPAADGTVEVREAGTGFMMIHREVYEKMIEKFSDEMRYEADMGDVPGPRSVKYDFFTVGVRLDPLAKYKRFLSEDWYFCQRWREIGGKIIMQTKICCGHIGKFQFPGNPNDIIEAAEIYKKTLGAPAPVKSVKVRTVQDEPAKEEVAVAALD